jgi:hypothetical protein
VLIKVKDGSTDVLCRPCPLEGWRLPVRPIPAPTSSYQSRETMAAIVSKQANTQEACFPDSITRACSGAGRALKHCTPVQTLPSTHPHRTSCSSVCRLRPAAWQLRHIHSQQREELPVQLLQRTRPPHTTTTAPATATAGPGCISLRMLLCCWRCWCRATMHMASTFTATNTSCSSCWAAI